MSYKPILITMCFVIPYTIGLIMTALYLVDNFSLKVFAFLSGFIVLGFGFFGMGYIEDRDMERDMEDMEQEWKI